MPPKRIGSDRPRSIRDTSFFAAAVGLYGILIGLALVDPLDRLAADVLANPRGGDWTLRFMVVGLFAETAIWFHALVADMGLLTFSGPTTRHPELPGATAFRLYRTALEEFWLGAVVVVLLFVLARAVPVGLSAFLSVFVVYAVWSAFRFGAYLVRHRAHALQAADLAKNPFELVRLLGRERHVPTTAHDVDILAGASDRMEVMWATAVWYSLLVAVGIVAWTALLLLGYLIGGPAVAPWVAAAWLASVVAAIVADYVLLPQFYAT